MPSSKTLDKEAYYFSSFHEELDFKENYENNQVKLKLSHLYI